MTVQVRKKGILAVLIPAALLFCAALFFTLPKQQTGAGFTAGGSLHPSVVFEQGSRQADVKTEDAANQDERFRRPSKLPALENQYSFQDFVKSPETPPLITAKFKTPEELILAFYGILREAANLEGYSGGCGTVGDTCQPYPYAYELLTESARKSMPLQEFKNSFRGVGYLSLLRLLPAYAPAGTPAGRRYYMVEIEEIVGTPQGNSGASYRQGTQFAYYYGIVTAEQTPGKNFLIAKIDYIPEDFLCAPLHGWSYDALDILQIVYQESMKLIDRITGSEANGGLLTFYASGQGQEYRFDFVRLANGYDILLHEYQKEDGVWKEVNLLTGAWEYLKFSIQNPAFQQKAG